MDATKGWAALAEADLPELVTVIKLADATGFTPETIRRQLGRGRWGIAPVGREIGTGAMQYPLLEVRVRAAGPGRGNRTRGAERSEQARRGWAGRCSRRLA